MEHPFIFPIHSLRPSIDLKFEPSPVPLRVMADKSQLEQVLLNICFNARDAISGRGRIEVSLAITPPRAEEATDTKADPVAAPKVCICIRDTGSGIATEVLPHIFEPFFTTKAEGSGTGLGLANCHSIVKQHKGDITAASTPGQGSEFQVCLPLIEADSPAAAPPVEARRPASTAKGRNERSVKPAPTPAEDQAGDAGGGCILVVDDDAEILRLTAALLRNAGYDTLIASDGEAALQQLARHHEQISLVLMDVLMPVLGGIETAERIQSDYPGLPILLMSGYAPEGSLGAGLRLLRKPFTRETLLQAVRQMRGIPVEP